MLGLPKGLLIYFLLISSLFVANYLLFADLFAFWIVYGITLFSYIGSLYTIFRLRETNTLAYKIHKWLSS